MYTFLYKMRKRRKKLNPNHGRHSERQRTKDYSHVKKYEYKDSSNAIVRLPQPILSDPLDKEPIKTIKCKLDKFTREPHHLQMIQDAVSNVNVALRHVTQMLKMYLMTKIDQPDEFPVVDTNFIIIACKVVCSYNPNSSKDYADKNKVIFDELTNFYNEHYAPLHYLDEKVPYLNLLQIFKYEAKTIETSIKNNIIAQFRIRFCQLLNHHYNVKAEIKAARQTGVKSELVNTANNIKYHFFNHGTDKKKDRPLPNDIRDVVLDYRSYYLPNQKPTKENVDYDLRKNTLRYLRSLFLINRELEVETDKTFNAFPLKRSFIHGQVTFDTTMLGRLLGDTKTRSQATLKEYAGTMKKIFWNKYFIFNLKPVPSEFNYDNDVDYINGSKQHPAIREPYGYYFSGMIKSDGVSASLLYKRYDVVADDNYGNRKREIKVDPNTGEDTDKDELHVTDIAPDSSEFQEFAGKRIVAIDPNKDDIIYCTNGEQNFRYTLNQRDVETKSRRYKKLMEQDKQFQYDIDGEVLSVNDMQTKISESNSKSSDLETFTNFVATKNSFSSALTGHYNFIKDDSNSDESNRLNYRRLRFNVYNNRRRSEDRMVNRFKAKFGLPDQTFIAFGNAGSNHVKGKAVVKHKSMRKLFRRHGYDVLLVDEFRTSKMCYECHKELENVYVDWVNKDSEVESVHVHGLKRCTTETCKAYKNRDTNASMNILTVVQCHFQNLPRPTALCRQKKSFQE